jgi:thiamine-phosphate pyrophosphorylase
VSLPNKLRRAPILCYVTDRHLLPKLDAEPVRENLLNKIEAAASAGVDWIQIREKDLSGRDCALLTRDALRRVAKSSAGHAVQPRLFVNDRLDVALSEHAGGVHLGERSLPVAEARRLADSRPDHKNFLIGVSCHSVEGAQSARRDGADYIFFGPVFATPSKAAFGAPQGLQRLAEVCAAIPIPVIGIGGITLENASRCLQAGAAGLAAIRLFQQAQDLVSLVRALRELAV